MSNSGCVLIRLLKLCLTFVLLCLSYAINQEIIVTTMFSPSTSWHRSSSQHWHFFTTTGELNISPKVLLLKSYWYLTCVMILALYSCHLFSQVPLICFCGRHFLLLCRDDLCCRRHLRTLQQNNAAVFHSSSGKLCLLFASALPHYPMSQAPAPKVTHSSWSFKFDSVDL